MNRQIGIGLKLTGVLFACALSMAFVSMSNKAGQRQGPIPRPKVDHHMHIWTREASALVTDPLPPTIEMPAELQSLMKLKEDWDEKKDRAALKDIYTEDAAVLDAGQPIWLKGKAALDYVAESTIIYKIVPTAYDLGTDMGYVAGMEALVQDDRTQYVTNFLYVVKKGADGKWRVAAETFTMEPPPSPRAISPEQIIADLDAAGIQKGVVLSTAFWYASAFLDNPVPNEREGMQAENDWVGRQVARFPDRLIGFFSVNPLRDYAVDEIARCAKNKNLKGLKLHFGNGKADLLNADHVEKCRRVFKAANDLRIPIVVHTWTSGGSGAAKMKAFLDGVLTAAPDITVQIAHLAVSGPGYHSDEEMGVLAEAAEKKDPRMKNVYIDIASMVTATSPKRDLDQVAKRLRQTGLKKILFASDRSDRNDPPGQAWSAFLRLPLTREEFTTVANNVAPYAR